MMRKENDIYRSSLLTELGVVHGYSTRHFGDLRWNKNKDQFLEGLRMKRGDLVIGEQVHGIEIAMVRDIDRGKILPGVDGLVLGGLKLNLGVTFADCVPILAVDPKAGIIGTAHAGWKGTLRGIARELVSTIKQAGASPNTIYISIGPHIGMCCYNVGEDRALAFQKVFGENEKIAARISDEWHLDIGYANYQQILDSGIKKEHIDAPATCTSCQVEEFNSFRADPKEKFGVQLGVIAL